MAKRTIDLRGYIGEAIVRQWLHYRYPEAEGYEIKYQILPSGIDRSGGPYLDFGILKDGLLEYVYEVKTQDYKLDKLNKALKYIWENQGDLSTFEVQNDPKKYPVSPNFEAILILLVQPNFNKLEIFRTFGHYIRYFNMIFDDPDFQIDVEAIKDDFFKNYEIELKFLRKISLKAKAKSF